MTLLISIGVVAHRLTACRLIVFDRSVAFIPADDVIQGAAAVVRDPSLVGFFCSCFEHAWVSAKAFDAQGIRIPTPQMHITMKQ